MARNHQPDEGSGKNFIRERVERTPGPTYQCWLVQQRRFPAPFGVKALKAEFRRLYALRYPRTPFVHAEADVEGQVPAHFPRILREPGPYDLFEVRGRRPAHVFRVGGDMADVQIRKRKTCV